MEENKKKLEELAYEYANEGKAALAERKLNQAALSMQQAINHFKEAGNLSMYARSLNMLGVIDGALGNETMAVDYYLEGLECSIQNNFSHITILFYNNIGSRYLELNEHERAIGYFLRAEEELDSDVVKQEETYSTWCLVTYLNLLLSYTALKNFEQAEYYLQKALPYLELEENREQLFEYNFMYYNALLPYAEDFGVKIAIENINGSIWKSAENVAKLYDELNNSNFVVCFDVGHGNIIGEDPAEMIRTLSDRIKCTHVHDNNSTADSHTLPFYGTIDWESVMKAFAEVGYIGNLNYEAGLFVKNVPETLRPDAAKYMAKVGRHLIERYNYYRNNK